MKVNSLFAPVLLSALTFAFVTGCSDNTASSSNAIDADMVFVNGTIWTADPQNPSARVLAVKDDKIIYLGDEAPTTHSGVKTVDLQQRFMMPGFIDNHLHFLDGGFSLASVDLRDAKSKDTFINRIAQHAKGLQAGEWVLNGNWDHTLWGGEMPTKSWLDPVTGDTPVAVMRIDAHLMLANSAALKLAGIDANTPTPEGGEIQKDANGEPTGILKDTAMFKVMEVIPKPSDEQWRHALALAQEHAFSLGLTQVHVMVAGENETDPLKPFLLAQEADELKIRAKVFAPIQQWQQTADYVKQFGPGKGKLSWNGAKALTDGALGSGTAWFHEPFVDEPDNSGFPLTAPNNLKQWMQGAYNADVKMAIHAIGDKAIDTAIDIFADLAGEDTRAQRFRIEHFQHPSAEAVQRIADLGIIAAAHPYHAIDDGRWAENRLGAERIKTTYPFKSILDAGGILSFGSDWPVAPLAPMDGVYAAVTRRTLDDKNPDGWIPEQKISVEQALTAYTRTNAYLGFDEANTGTLATGKQADLIILSEDPRKVAPETLRGVKVTATMVAGEWVFGTP